MLSILDILLIPIRFVLGICVVIIMYVLYAAFYGVLLAIPLWVALKLIGII